MSEHLKIPTPAKVSWVTSRSIWYFSFVLLCVICGFALAFIDPIIVAGIMGFVVMTAILFYYPWLGVLVYLVFEYARIPAMFPSLQSLQIGKLIVVSTLLVWLFRSAIMKDAKFVSDKINWLMFLWLALAVGSSFVARDNKAALAAITVFAKWVVVYLLIINLVNGLGKWQWVTWTILLLNLKLSQFQIKGYVRGLGATSDVSELVTQGVGAGSTAFFANATDFGAAMCVVVPLALYAIKAGKHTSLKLLGLICLAAFLVSILQSGSRGAALAMLVMALFFWVKSSKKVLIGIVLVLFTLGYWVSAPSAWKQRFGSALEYEQDRTASSRIMFWQAGLKMLIEHPLTGVGIDNFGRNFAAKYSGGGEWAGTWAPHSIFVQAGAELGIVGILNFLAILYLIFRRNGETRRLFEKYGLSNDWIPSFSHALDLSLVGFIVSGTFLTILYYPHLYIIMSLAVSLNHITRKLAESRVTVTPSGKT